MLEKIQSVVQANYFECNLTRNSITCVIKLFSALLKICAILSKIESIFCKFHVKYPKLVTKEKKAKYLLSQECFLCMLQGPRNHKGTGGAMAF